MSECFILYSENFKLLLFHSLFVYIFLLNIRATHLMIIFGENNLLLLWDYHFVAVMVFFLILFLVSNLFSILNIFLRVYSCLCAQESVLMVFRESKGMPGINLGWVHARQASYLLYYTLNYRASQVFSLHIYLKFSTTWSWA